MCPGFTVALVGAATLGALMSLERAARADCVLDTACPALSGIVFVAVGIPLIVVGANQRRHAQVSKLTASVCPWLAPRAAGLGLRLEL